MKELREMVNVTDIEFVLMGAATDIGSPRKLNGHVLRFHY